MAALTVELQGHRFPARGRSPAKQALQEVRFRLGAGERIAVIGPSGCGKSTLLNIIAGLLEGSSGKVDSGSAQRLAYVFQEPRLLPWRTVRENLRLVLPDEPAALARIEPALAEVGLLAAADTHASRLSLGMARRVALARAFVTRPDLLLLDEPFVSLDEPTAWRLRLLLLDLLERHGTSGILVTHALPEAIMLADRLLFLTGSPGRLLAVHDIGLTPAERRCPVAIEACRQRLIADERHLAVLLGPEEAAPRAPEAR